jgi:hypothetical protein
MWKFHPPPFIGINMQISLIENYVYTRKLDLHIIEQRSSCKHMEHYIEQNIRKDCEDIAPWLTQPKTTKLFHQYNLLMYPYPGFNKLYHKIKETFHSVNNHFYSNCPPYEEHHIQCWLNVYYKGEFIDWHGHWTPEHKSWHGFYCVDVEPNSYTTYKHHTLPNPINVISEDNLLVISRSDNDRHRSSEWNNENKPRITIAFDIVPSKILFETNQISMNHWIPI